ncbi:MAG: glycine--tRNA ligase subunit beta [Anaerolineae bacterium]|nr:glycine--tRNA ligase subunit beta [Anaerolineae bacterium]
MTKPLDFQSMILALQQYWADQGCLIWQPYYSQVGAGTMNPATFLRVLGPEPWNVAYIEPSVRPDDGRYGDNPNRLQRHYQLQVILKPDPGNPQELYLQSLQAIGIDPAKHDIRFVEDNWESPALGAWGLGWEVWLDGQEITQFTYFQQAGGTELDPVSVEITYGLDRIAAPLQGVHGFQHIQWSPKHTFGDVNLQGEQEHSKYYFEVADVARLRQMYDLFEAETESALEQGLVLPAYDHIIKCSHTFNVLDTRGAIGVTERQAYFRRMRTQAAKVSKLYIEDRQRQEFPWMDEGEQAVDKGKKAVKLTNPSEAAAFVLEIGTEELPPGDLDVLIAQLAERFPKMLQAQHLDHGDVKVLGTPRRLVVHVEALSARQPDREETVKGPPAERAFGADGSPNKAAEGFARGKGISVNNLEVQEIDGGKYVVAHIKEKGRPSVEVLAEALPELVAGLRVDRSMRWNSSNAAFSRPVRWLLALHGEHTVPFEYAGLQSGNATRGLRFNDADGLVVKEPADYFSKLKKQGIILDIEARRAAIATQVEALAQEVGGSIQEDAALLAEVTHLVEAPTALRGSFDEAHLELPRDVLVSVMKKHQRYFPVMKDGKLLPYFITVRNGGTQHLDSVAQGNEAVIRARFADAAFFVHDDMKQALKDFLPRLDTLTFQQKLGSMGDKTKRIMGLVDDLTKQIKLSKDETAAAKRGAQLCKADLVTKMVVEMTSLQGIIGQHYALASGEPQGAATAIYEHYLPRSAGDEAPQSKAGLVVGLADRLDSLTGLFAAGLAPTGTKDPFALRRAALGLVHNLITWDLDFDLGAAVKAAAARLPLEANLESQRDCLEFITGRMRGLFLEQGWRYDIVDSVLAAQGQNPAGAARAVQQLSTWIGREDWDTILPAYSRCVRITRDKSEVYPVDSKVFNQPAEKELYAALQQAEAAKPAAGSVDDFLSAFTPMIPAIDKFFEDVLVMDDDEKVRNNRLGLLQRIAALAEGAADLSPLEGF